MLLFIIDQRPLFYSHLYLWLLIDSDPRTNLNSYYYSDLCIHLDLHSYTSTIFHWSFCSKPKSIPKVCNCTKQWFILISYRAFWGQCCIQYTLMQKFCVEITNCRNSYNIYAFDEVLSHTLFDTFQYFI